MKNVSLFLAPIVILAGCGGSSGNNNGCAPAAPANHNGIRMATPVAPPPVNTAPQPGAAACPAPNLDGPGGGVNPGPNPRNPTNPGAAANLADIQGSWGSECLVAGNISSYFTYNFAANGEIIQSIQFSQTPNCADTGMLTEAQGKATGNAGTYDIAWAKLSVIPYMENFAQGFNQQKVCGFQDWQQGVEKQLNPIQCKNDRVFGDVAHNAKYKITKAGEGLSLQDLNQAAAAPIMLQKK